MAETNVPEDDIATQLGSSHLQSRFCLKKSLGVGGMGEVYLAEDASLRRLVAIKSVRPDLCKNEEIRKRIERECLLHAKVGPHPHIVTLFDKLEEGDRINLVMEYVEGETLQDMLERHAKQGTAPALQEALTIAVQCLEALARIHMHGIVHRDIKPSNIILAHDDCGEVCAKLMDFGIARAQDDEFASRLTQQFGSGPGTPLYMAPEQIDPQTFGEVSPATDVYAMGIMLYQMTSGEPPFSGTLTQIFNGHLHGQPPPLSERARGRVPDSLVDIIHCALAKQPEQRFPSAKAFREELIRIGLEVKSGGAACTRVTVDPTKTLVASGAAKTALPGHTFASGAAVAGLPGSTMLSGAAIPGTEVRRRRKLVKLAAGAAAVVLIGAGGALGYQFMSSEGDAKPAEAAATDTTTPASTEPAATAPASPQPNAAAPTQPAAPAQVDASAAPPAANQPPAPDTVVPATAPPPDAAPTAPAATAPVPATAPPADAAPTAPSQPTPVMDGSATPPPAVAAPADAPQPPATVPAAVTAPDNSLPAGSTGFVQGSSSGASSAFEEALKAKGSEPPAPDVTPTSVTPDIPAAPAPEPVKPKKKSAQKPATVKAAEPKVEPKPEPKPAPAKEPSSSGGSGWNVVSEGSRKAN